MNRDFFYLFFIPSITTLNLTTIYHRFSIHLMYYYLSFTLFIDLYFNILIFTPTAQITYVILKLAARAWTLNVAFVSALD